MLGTKVDHQLYCAMNSLIALGIDIVTADNTSMKTTALLLPGLLDSSYLNAKM